MLSNEDAIVCTQTINVNGDILITRNKRYRVFGRNLDAYLIVNDLGLVTKFSIERSGRYYFPYFFHTLQEHRQNQLNKLNITQHNGKINRNDRFLELG